MLNLTKVIIKSGKRKTAIAKATLRPGTGKIKINNVSIEHYEPELYKLRIQEPLILASDVVVKVDISVTVKGGGLMSQSDASRLAIARALS